MSRSLTALAARAAHSVRFVISSITSRKRVVVALFFTEDRQDAGRWGDAPPRTTIDATVSYLAGEPSVRRVPRDFEARSKPLFTTDLLDHLRNATTLKENYRSRLPRARCRINACWTGTRELNLCGADFLTWVMCYWASVRYSFLMGLCY